MSSKAAKNFSYIAYMHLGNHESKMSCLERLLQLEVSKNNETSETRRHAKFRRKDVKSVAEIVVFRLHVRYSVRLKSFTTPMKCSSCRVGFGGCPCHTENSPGIQIEDVSIRILNSTYKHDSGLETVQDKKKKKEKKRVCKEVQIRTITESVHILNWQNSG